MKSQHRRTLQALYAHPLQHGLRTSQVEALLVSLGAEVELLSDQRLQVRLPGGETTWLRAAAGLHHPCLDEEAVLRIRRLLEKAGITPEHPEAEAAAVRGDQGHRLVICLDHRGAELWQLEGDQVAQAELRSHGLWGSDQNLSHRHERDIAGQRAPLDHAYLERLSGAIAAADVVLLLGHGHGQSDMRELLLRHLRHRHPQLLERIVGVLGIDDSALTPAQLLALAREHFGNQPHRRPLVVPGQEPREPEGSLQ
ncbi:MAG: hypothetical protein EBX49_10965 [Synechococcaceae bacterium WB8_1B_136]|nr:hypothetical protein [Synechococcaceae bacterium WB8_1B_136]